MNSFKYVKQSRSVLCVAEGNCWNAKLTTTHVEKLWKEKYTKCVFFQVFCMPVFQTVLN